jgi:hypothetical protein
MLKFQQFGEAKRRQIPKGQRAGFSTVNSFFPRWLHFSEPQFPHFTNAGNTA